MHELWRKIFRQFFLVFPHFVSVLVAFSLELWLARWNQFAIHVPRRPSATRIIKTSATRISSRRNWANQADRKFLKSLPFHLSIFSHVLAPIWDKKKSIGANMRAAGLVLNPNKLIKLRQAVEEPEAMDLEEALTGRITEKPEKKVSVNFECFTWFFKFRSETRKPRVMPRRLKRRHVRRPTHNQIVQHRVCPPQTCSFVNRWSRNTDWIMR